MDVADKRVVGANVSWYTWMVLQVHTDQVMRNAAHKNDFFQKNQSSF